MRTSVRDAIRRRFHYKCAYCGVAESDQGARLTIDHFQPISQGGTNDEENLVYACHACNEFKGDFWQTDPTLSLLHPERDDLSQHLVESIQHLLVPLTDRGRIYIAVARLNRPETVERRRQVYQIAQRQEILTELIQRFESLESEIVQLRKSLE